MLLAEARRIKQAKFGGETCGGGSRQLAQMEPKWRGVLRGTRDPETGLGRHEARNGDSGGNRLPSQAALWKEARDSV